MNTGNVVTFKILLFPLRVYPQLPENFKYLRIYNTICEWMCVCMAVKDTNRQSFKCSSICNINKNIKMRWK